MQPISLVQTFTHTFKWKKFSIVATLKLQPPHCYGRLLWSQAPPWPQYYGYEALRPLLWRRTPKNCKSLRIRAASYVWLWAQFQVLVTTPDTQTGDKCVASGHQRCLSGLLRMRKLRLWSSYQSMWLSDWIQFDSWSGGREQEEKKKRRVLKNPAKIPHQYFLGGTSMGGGMKDACSW